MSKQTSHDPTIFDKNHIDRRQFWSRAVKTSGIDFLNVFFVGDKIKLKRY